MICFTSSAQSNLSNSSVQDLKIDFFEYINGRSNIICSLVTNADGRTDKPVLTETDFRFGSFELIFHVGDYFRQFEHRHGEHMFLDLVPVRFGMSENKHYHVPLLVSPFGYSTYRGS